MRYGDLVVTLSWYSWFISTPRRGSVPMTCKDVDKLDFLNKLTHTWAFAVSPVLIVNILLDNSHELKKFPDFDGELRATCGNRKAHLPCLLGFAAVVTNGWQLKFLKALNRACRAPFMTRVWSVSDKQNSESRAYLILFHFTLTDNGSNGTAD